MGFFDFLKGSTATPQPAAGQADTIDLNRPEYKQGCGRVGDGLLHLDWARQAACAGDADRARMEYMKSAESWKQANETEGGKWARELDLANKEYADFVQTDQVYRNGIAVLLPIIKATPGILQTDLYKACPGIERETISYILYFAASSEVIRRTKKGRTYELHAA
ncbi:MAG: hypothetical protein HYV06_04310 [Deltaproteobacteria bacterium]|nr:hypothetical protein [Deltaproteobacteria bacterium]